MKAKPGEPGRHFLDDHPSCVALLGDAICIANEEHETPYEERDKEHTVFRFRHRHSAFELVEGLPVRAYLSHVALGEHRGRALFAKADEASQVFAWDLGSGEQHQRGRAGLREAGATPAKEPRQAPQEARLGLT